MEIQKFIELDVRDDLAKKIEPFNKIMAAVQQLKDDQVFVLHAPFNPVPLHTVMKRKGFENSVVKIEKKHWKVTYTKKEV